MKLTQLREPFSNEIRLGGRTLKQLKQANERSNGRRIWSAWHRFKAVIEAAAEEGVRNHNPNDELLILTFIGHS